MSQQTLSDYSTDAVCPTCGDAFGGEVAMKAHHQHHDKPYYDVVVENEFSLSPPEFLQKYYHDEGNSLEETGELIGASNTTIETMADRHDVPTRTPSEAQTLEWEQRDESEYGKFLDAAHERTRELVSEGEHNLEAYWDSLTEEERRELSQPARDAQYEKYGPEGAIAHWIKQNPEEHAEVARRAGPLGAPARKKNGMAGVTGQDHPRWRGGKSIYDAVKKQLTPSFYTVRDDARADECHRCGASGCKLDVHHLVPIMSGGTNDSWNFMTLCESCHRKAESFIRQYPEFDPVLVEP